MTPLKLKLNWPIDHIAIATPDLERGSAPYLALGFAPLYPDEEILEQGVRVRVFRSGDSLIELLAPLHESSPIAKFLQARGPGLHHMALRVPSLEPEIERLGGLGATFLTETPQAGRAGTRVIFLHPKWGAGTLLELIEHPHKHPLEHTHGAGH
jgi:methylmalonyl-CoA/ethylmalonyl-CoA epimerase